MEKKIKIALASPKIRLCDTYFNGELLIKEAKAAADKGANIICFPELSLTGATAKDLFFQEALASSALDALRCFAKETASLEIMSFVGLPLLFGEELYNAVAVVSRGEILGISASGLSDRHFSSVPDCGSVVNIDGEDIEVGRNLIFTESVTGAEIFVKIGEDNAWSSDGVDLILNPIAMPEYCGLSAPRREYVSLVSSDFGVPFAMVGAGEGESGTDGIYAGPRLVGYGGEVVCESRLFDTEILYADLSLGRYKSAEKAETAESKEAVLRSPFIPEDSEERKETFELALEIQARSLAGRMERAYAKSAVIGVSGGLDSTLALLVCARACDILGRGRDSVIAITMPCFGTTERTKSNALVLAEELGCSLKTIDIKAAVTQHFKDISHDEGCYDVVYENAQARERTQILMDVANAAGGMVIGTGDLSELALGFATYNGDHMSMYCVNGSVPKTLMRAMIAHFAKKAMDEGREKLSRVLTDVIETPVSPELLPSDGVENKQHTETIVGPYELHDFFLYYTVKYGWSPKRILNEAKKIFTEYKSEDIKSYLKIFIKRFISQQFKRSCLPDGPRVTEISLSPRGAWQMPSDAAQAVWLKNLEEE